MNVLPILMAVLKSVATLLDHTSVAVTVAIVSPAMEEHVWTSMNAY